ncbi:MAG: dTMP kinase [Candidatus Aenigmatarchaeota archaeon]
MRKGIFIVLEGIDGCGKSLQSNLLFNFLKEKREAILTHEPTQGEIGSLLSRKYLKEVDLPLVDAFLFCADREEHLKTVVIPALEQGKIVISDRYYHSTLAYQKAQGLELKWLLDLNKFFIKPNLTIILDVDPEVAIERIEKDKNRKIEERKKFEQIEFLKKVRANFLELPKILKDEKIVVIDGNKEKEKVFEEILKEVEKNFLISKG